MSAPETIHRLVENFASQRDSYRSGTVKEATIRQEFIDPFFESLGWDLRNIRGHAEAYKDVMVEPSLDVEGETKAPDYAFRVGGTRKFLVEAKKPSVNIEQDIYPAFQLRRYTWSAKLPLGILTDFEEFAVYDCRTRPSPKDKPGTDRIMLLRYQDYIEQWDQIASIFSKEAVLKGSFDQFAQSSRGKRGTQEVDEEFLKEIEGWRDLLARNLALRNNSLTTPELNYAVQMTIDRIVFLRICEDREIEPHGQLKNLTAGGEIYPNLVKLFRQADKRYNSGLFHFEKEKGESTSPDGLTPALSIDDKVMKDIICSLYYPSPYMFNQIPSDILGQVYERFLGKVIRLTAGHQAKVEEKPEVRKAGGVYYTPTYIVDYIVENTVGKLLAWRTPESASTLKIVDPACGSGSFLLGAYQRLLDWHLDWYGANDPQKWRGGAKPRIYQGQRGEWALTTTEKKRILLNNIHGVDIDPQAVEVTKLSLSLKVLEGENQETIGAQLGLFKERALPDLGHNIQCGNSLIGPDYTEGRQLSLLDDEERARVNAFDWRAAFPEVFAQGGFDAVIGNPPYVRQETLGIQKEYFQKHYKTYAGTADLYTYFIEKGVNLLRPGGYFSYIVANKWMRANYGKPLRQWLKQQEIEEIVDFGDLPVFERATTYPCVLSVRSGKKQSDNFTAVNVKTLDFQDLQVHVNENEFSVQKSRLSDEGWALADGQVAALLEKIKSKGIPLGEYVKGKIYRGILTGLNEAFVIDRQTRERFINEDPKCEELIVPFLAGRDIKRYEQPKSDKFLILIPKGWTRQNSNNARDSWGWFKQNYPSMAAHLGLFEKKAQQRQDKGEYWWELRACDYYDEFKKPKIMLPDISFRGNFLFDQDGKYFSVNTTYIIPVCDLYLLGLLNSKLISYYYRQISSSYRGGYLRFIFQYLVSIPIPQFDSPSSDNINPKKNISDLVERLLVITKREGRTPQERELLKREQNQIDSQIDKAVFDLYEMNEDEIKNVLMSKFQ